MGVCVLCFQKHKKEKLKLKPKHKHKSNLQTDCPHNISICNFEYALKLVLSKTRLCLFSLRKKEFVFAFWFVFSTMQTQTTHKTHNDGGLGTTYLERNVNNKAQEIADIFTMWINL